MEKWLSVVDDEDRENEGDLIIPAQRQLLMLLILWQLMAEDLYALTLNSR